ncbi:MAG: hypothetical protein ABI221_01360 [Candidatus Saccharimonadales bacterium]
MSEQTSPTMPAVLQFHGLDLPTFEAADVLDTPMEFALAAFDEGSETFVRRSYVRAVGFSCLRDVLRITDEELGLASELCQANLIGYQWGLFPVSSRYRQIMPTQFNLLPNGYALAAEVGIIRDVEDLSNDSFNRTIPDGLEQYARLRNAKHNQPDAPRLSDLRRGQFVSGLGPDDRRADWLIDIEPMITIAK